MTVSDDELAAFAIEIFGFDDIDEVIGTFLADCVGTAVCEITAHGLLVLLLPMRVTTTKRCTWACVNAPADVDFDNG